VYSQFQLGPVFCYRGAFSRVGKCTEENNYCFSCLKSAILSRNTGRMTKYLEPSSSSFAETKRRE
jgi:hypothetical protein